MYLTGLKYFMFFLHTTQRNIIRNLTKSVPAVFAGALIVLLLNLYVGNIRSGQNQLNDLADALTIRADISNLIGSQITALRIKDDTVRLLESSGHVNGLTYSVELVGGLGAFSPEEWRRHLNINITAVNTMSAVPGLTADNVTFSGGTDADILHSDHAVCLITEDFSMRHDFSAGDAMQLTLYYYDYPSSEYEILMIYPLGFFDLTIAGVIGEMLRGGGDFLQPDVILPIEWVRNAYAQIDAAFYPTSSSFTVADPLRLDEFKMEMQLFNLMETSPTANFSHNGNSLMVNDKTFIEAASHLRENLRVLVFFLPFILAIVIFVGYLTSYLLMQNRRREFAVMRSLGTGQRVCFYIFTLENAVLALSGGFFGSLAAALLIEGAAIGVLFLSAGVFFVCYLLGTAAALYGLGRFSVIDVLCQID